MTRPVMPADSSEHSHVTIGAIQRGDTASRSSSVSGAGPRPSVIRVSATGRDGVDGHAVAGHLQGDDVGERGDAGLGRAVVGLAGVAVDAATPTWC